GARPRWSLSSAGPASSNHPGQNGGHRREEARKRREQQDFPHELLLGERAVEEKHPHERGGCGGFLRRVEEAVFAKVGRSCVHLSPLDETPDAREYVKGIQYRGYDRDYRRELHT